MNQNQNMHNGYTSAFKLRLALTGMALMLFVGSSGFMIIEGMTVIDALYMTVITLSTVGFGEVMPLHENGRIFVIFLIIFGVVLAGFTVTTIGQMALEGQIRELFGRKKMGHKINKMRDHYIIAGYGRVGRQVASEFKKKNVNFVVIDKEEEAIEEMSKENMLFIQGDATSDDTLRDSGIESANTLISTLPDEAQNVYLTLTARDMNRKLHIIARADYDEGVKKLTRAGADHVVTPHVLGGIRMAMASLRPNVVDFMHSTSLGQGGLMIEEMVIPEGCLLSGKAIKDSGLKQDYGITIIGIKKPEQDMTIAPGPDTVLEHKDILVLIGDDSNLEKLSDLIC